jgi:hypothetical protein
MMIPENPISRSSKEKPAFLRPWTGVFLTTILAAGTYSFMEWLFIVTKPSFLNGLSTFRQIEVLLFFTALVVLTAIITLLPLVLISLFPAFQKARPVMQNVGLLAPAVILATLTLLLLDNFTYTVFRIGIVSSEGLARLLYAFVFVALVVWFWQNAERFAKKQATGAKGKGWQNIITISFLVAALCILAVAVMRKEIGSQAVQQAAVERIKNRPHILLITSDGVNAANMSLYGYKRETSPRLQVLAESSLVAENAFPNSGSTAGSIISLYTGKYPSVTRVMYPPNILRGANAYQHLPGILRNQGYRTVQVSYPHYVDAYSLNVLEGFDIANDRSMPTSGVLVTIQRYVTNDYAYFLYETTNRIVDRLRHILFIKRMTNPYDLVTEEPDIVADLHKVNGVLDLIREADQPLFVHLHLMGTHGPKYYPINKVFSAGQENKQQEVWNTDYYDDSILQFDTYVGSILDVLRETEKFDQTILVIGSDHGQQFVPSKRIPLLIHFPAGAHARRITTNVQNLDIAPTLLDFLEIPIPGYMQGQSLLRLDETQRPIFAFRNTAIVKGGDEASFELDVSRLSPPFYQFGRANLEYCQVWYQLDLYKKTWSTGEILGYVQPCSNDMLLTNEQALDLIVQHLKSTGFDTSSLRPDEIFSR